VIGLKKKKTKKGDLKAEVFVLTYEARASPEENPALLQERQAATMVTVVQETARNPILPRSSPANTS
jgi:hypothetical protein